MIRRCLLLLGPLFLLACHQEGAAPKRVGPAAGDSAIVVPTGQLIRPAGQLLSYDGRPIDLVLSPDQSILFVKDHVSILVIDAREWKVIQQLPYPKKCAASLCGLATSRDGKRVFVTTSGSTLFEATLDGEKRLSFPRSISLKRPGYADSYPCGIALSADETTAFICLSVTNELAIVDLAVGKATTHISTGIAPYAVAVSPDGKTAYVSNAGGRRPTATDKTAKSAGTETVIDDRGVASSGSVSIIDLTTNRVLEEVSTDLRPGALALTKDGKTLYIANANSDTVSVLDTATRKITREISVYPDPSPLFGSLPNALALSTDVRNQSLRRQRRQQCDRSDRRRGKQSRRFHSNRLVPLGDCHGRLESFHCRHQGHGLARSRQRRQVELAQLLGRHPEGPHPR